MGSVSSPFFCKIFQLSKNYEEITKPFLCIVQNTDTNVAYDQLLFFNLKAQTLVCGTVLNCHDVFWSHVDRRVSEDHVTLS